MATNKISALLVCPNELPKFMEISNTLHEQDKLLHGNMDISYIPDDNEVCIIFNKYTKLSKFLVNRDIGGQIIYGDFLIVGNDLDNGEFKSLSKQQIDKYSKLFDKDSIVKVKNRMNARILVNKLMCGRK